jgi:hypothetical protein
MTVPFPSPTVPANSRAEVFTRYLAFFRDRLTEKVRELPAGELRRSRLPSGWTPLDDLRAGDLVVPLAAPGLHRDQAGLQQPGQVGTGQRGGRPRAGGQLACREFLTAEEGEAGS